MIRTSEHTDKIDEALAAAHGELSDANVTAKNPHYDSDYAELVAYTAMARPVLARHQLVLTQTPTSNSEGHWIITRIAHKGQFIESALRLELSKKDMQGLGSAITYGRRYAMAGALGMAQKDDDANASIAPNTPARAHAAPAPVERQSDTQSGTVGSYVVQCGKKYQGQSLEAIGAKDVASYLGYLHSSGKPLNGTFKEFAEKAEQYLAQEDQLPF